MNPLELPPPERTERLLLLPDGTAAPSLNDVLNPRALATAWSPTRPYAPIIATFSEDNGEQWYRHADGTVSTTVMRWRADLGRMDGVTMVMHPRGAPQARVRIHDR